MTVPHNKITSTASFPLLNDLDGPYGPQCWDRRTFPYIQCEGECHPYNLRIHRGCQQQRQFGCHYARCEGRNHFTCALTPEAAAQTNCEYGQIYVKSVSLQQNRPVDFQLAVNLPGRDIDVVLLIDASSSTRPRLNAVKNQLVSFVRQLSGRARVAVAIYGGEDSFDETGMKVLSAASEDVQLALNALESIPTFPDGVRTTLTALHSVVTSQELSLLRERSMIVLLGDTPGREPECRYQLSRSAISNELYGFTSGFSVIPVSLGGVGLDAALAPISPCSNGYGSQDPQPVAAGQASNLAEQTKGEVIQSITTSNLFDAVDRVRRNPARTHQAKPGAEIYISTASVEPVNQPYYPRQERINGCGDRITTSVTGVPRYVSEPFLNTGSLRLALAQGACRRGGFECQIRIMDHVRGYESMSHWSRPIVNYKKISIRACM
ncbi:unnamed protein product [Agarophyton chilense]